MPAGKRLVTGSHDKFMMLADIHGHVQRTWKASHVHDLAISADGSLLFCVTSERKVRLQPTCRHAQPLLSCYTEVASA